MHQENEKNSQQQMILSILEFMHDYDPEVNMQNLFNGSSFHRLLLTADKSQSWFRCQIDYTATKWSQKFWNFILLLKKMNQYVSQVYQNKKQLNYKDIDIVSMCKYEQDVPVVKFFELIMSVVLQSQNKDLYIQTIMSLQDSSQEYFVEIIKNAMQLRITSKQTDESMSSQYMVQLPVLSRVIQEAELDHQSLYKEMKVLEGKNQELLIKIDEYELAMSKIEDDISNKQNIHKFSQQENSKISYLEDYVDKLKEKILISSKQSEVQQYTLNNRIKELQEKCHRQVQMQQLANIYKQKYEDVIDQVQKISIWKKQKIKLQKIIQQKEFAMQKLQERVDQLTQKNIILEEKDLDMKLQLQKKNISLQRMNHQVHKTKQNFMKMNCNKTFSPTSTPKNRQSLLKDSINTRDNRYSLCPGLVGKKVAELTTQLPVEEELIQYDDEETHLLKKNNEQLQLKIKQLEKQISKLQKKCERVRILEEEKKKLELLVYELRMMKSQQTNLLVSVLSEKFEDKDTRTKSKLTAPIIDQKEPTIIKKRSKRRMPSILTQNE